MASTANMSKFKGNIGTGLVRPNQFICTLDILGNPDAAKNSQFLCRAASLPGSTVAPIPVYYRGRAFNVAGERQFQPWTVTIYNENFWLRDALVNWSNSINNISNNTGILAPKEYQKRITVQQLDRNEGVMKTIEMVSAFPVDISPIELDWENNAQVEMFQCTFVYDWYYDMGVNPEQNSAQTTTQTMKRDIASTAKKAIVSKALSMF